MNNYPDFSAKGYLNEYYDEIEENADTFLMNHFHVVFSSMIGGKMLEIGGGPTIYQLLSAGLYVNEIVFTDYLEENLEEVRKWKEMRSDAFDWKHYLEFAAKIEGENKEELQNLLREKISKIAKCDIFSENPISPIIEKFDIVSTNFCPESVATNEADFIRAVKNISTLLKKNGILSMSLLRNAKYYTIYGKKIPCYSANEDKVKKILEEIGFRKIEVDSLSVDYEGEGYDGMITIRATSLTQE